MRSIERRDTFKERMGGFGMGCENEKNHLTHGIVRELRVERSKQGEEVEGNIKGDGKGGRICSLTTARILISAHLGGLITISPSSK